MEEAKDVEEAVEWPGLSAERGKTVGERRDNPNSEMELYRSI